MLSAGKALQKILHAAKPLPSTKVKLRNALHRVLAETVTAGENIPPFDNGAMDGFVVRSGDVSQASKRTPAALAIVGESSAGNVFRKRVGKGEAVRIMTGGKIPRGADAVVPIELVQVKGDTHILVTSPAKPGQHIRRAGEDIRKNEIVLKRGELLTPARLGVLASLGRTKVRVARRPHVNILATGDELVEVRERPREGQIRNSSSYALAGLVEQHGGVSRMLGVVSDRKKKMRKAVKRGLDCDILLITGGVSVGKYDFVKEILKDAGVTIVFWQVNIKPGRPLLFGKIKRTLVFGLPGNPVSTGVTFLQFVRPAIHRTAGRSDARPVLLSAVLDEEIRKNDGKRHFLRGIAARRGGVLYVRKTGSQSSGVMSSLAKGNCLIIVPEKTTLVKKGEMVEIELLHVES